MLPEAEENIQLIEKVYDRCERILTNQLSLLKHTFEGTKNVKQTSISGKRTAGVSYEIKDGIVYPYYITKLTIKVPINIEITKQQLDSINITVNQEF